MANPFDGVRAVLFDLDGTLVETNIDFPLLKLAMLDLAERNGIERAELETLDILAVVDEAASEVAQKRGPEAAEEFRREAFEILEDLETVFCEAARPIPGAADLLAHLAASGIVYAVVTRNGRRGALCSMGRCGIHVEILLTRDDIRNTKPHPDHLLHALEIIGVQPHEAVMVGDHWLDVQGGKAAGTRTVGLLHPDRPQDFFDAETPDLVVRSLTELIPLIGRSKD